jgi:hypothetical protein
VQWSKVLTLKYAVNLVFCTNGGGVGDESEATNGDNNKKDTGVGDESEATNGDNNKKATST